MICLYLSFHYITCAKKIKKSRRQTMSAATKYNKMVLELKRMTTHWYERYSPNYGYEPYWVAGDWVMMKNELFSSTMSPGQEVTQPAIVCGDECDFKYRRYGRLCAMSVGQYHSYWDTEDPQFHTFDSYCAMLAWNCDKSFDYKYIFAYLGYCINQKQLYRQDRHRYWEYEYNSKFLAPRPSYFINKLSKLFTSANVTAKYQLWIQWSTPPGNEMLTHD
ncbi:hypothetical protein O0L34_g2197 [Tuta absoluta]|nr:hypothetical protein O0L34_g2197 [Tuta absoluta]